MGSVTVFIEIFLCAPVAKLAYAPDLGSGGKPCRFKSCQAHQRLSRFMRAPNQEGASLYSLQLKNLFGHNLTIQNMVGSYSRVSNNDSMIYRYDPISMELSCIK